MKRKGFTLIELLAVIVILAVIALISMPLVLNTIDKAKSYSDGEVIPESNIESYFVWIPRYKYRIFNEGNYTGYITGSRSNITVKPNNTSLRNINVKTMFELSYNYNRNLDSHMLKNTEWGAVAYLSYSIYGINDEVNINNNSNYITGYSAVEGTEQSSYPRTYGTASNITQAYNTET